MLYLIALVMVLLNSGISPEDGLVSAAPFVVKLLTPTDDECTSENESTVCGNQQCYEGSPLKKKCALIQHYAKKVNDEDAATTNRFFNATLRYRKCICSDMCNTYPDTPGVERQFLNDLDQK